jgi:hypothetical protein
MEVRMEVIVFRHKHRPYQCAVVPRRAWRHAPRETSERLPLLAERRVSLSNRWPHALCVIGALRGRQRRVVSVVVAAIERAYAGAIALGAGVCGE